MLHGARRFFFQKNIHWGLTATGYSHITCGVMSAKTYYIQPSGSEEWVETKARTIKYLRDKGHIVEVDRREYAVFITIKKP